MLFKTGAACSSRNLEGSMIMMLWRSKAERLENLTSSGHWR